LQPAGNLFRGFAFALTLLPAAVAAAQGHAGKLTVVQGRVVVTRIGAETPGVAAQGAQIDVGDLLETGEDSRAQALLPDNTVLNVSTRTSVRILQYSWDPTQDRRTAVVKLQAGKVRFMVADRKDSRFAVETPEATVAAQVADFVAAASPGESRVAVLEGGVTLRSASKLIVEKVDLRTNQAAVVKSGAAPSYPVVVTAEERKGYRRDARVF
jgi:ferric-dicitrate binding protein FerR (iron transport regulator)